MNYRFNTADSPEANGHTPEVGDVQYPIYFRTDEGGRVTINMGLRGAALLAAAVLAMLADDEELCEEVRIIKVEEM